ncbi:hypothetical protein DPMN_107371 [Dreissena polymorpha]|uniref:Uncharacterized protein n=1 Tax=Dreissena polymorpha TaxID=45954 RepID=A0A9D4K6M2_DREPO|nr:hypothetical protein DPMN_107371 [Dreissena polymorpha]
MASNNNNINQTSSTEPPCVLHAGPLIVSEEIKLFDTESWTRVRKAFHIRKSKPNWNLSKYSAVCSCLPDSFSCVDGYHTTCYKNFTAISESFQLHKSLSTSSLLLRSLVDHPVTDPGGKFPHTCIFCGRAQIQRRGQLPELLGCCDNHEAEENIKQAAQVLHDQEMMAKVGSVDFIARQVRYHHSCRKQYINKSDRKRKIVKTECAINSPESMQPQKNKDHVFNKIKEHIDSHIIMQENPEILTSLYELYRTCLSK